ncbi:2,4-dihydroxyhept-2-ene-1,7-dioic acid aldolase [Oleiphilus messinensis]|uniref:2,4-dihydroxyhept-2-ene-1,7-dioic acid aldolase n=1 Tax=Oleiphilus messinensis TaxID=141451 RepID=A0A1Y0I5B0_9GAMM|nr:DUF2218 domain-containing protein [Oleiphilus messinensis]ARU54634.1 2,4-dihydroxyhept-2-ene-1,7-dioic acid aldolase [Oleiphilus messinensis]
MNETLCCQSLAFVATSLPAKYINRMCRHFSHKVDAEWGDDRGVIVFSIGKCLLEVDEGGLRVQCDAPDDEQLEELMEVVKSHFDRFAAQDGLELTWSASPATHL